MRTQLNNDVKLRINDKQKNFLKKLEVRHGISFSETIRVCIDHYMIVDAERSHRHKDIKKRNNALLL